MGIINNFHEGEGRVFNYRIGLFLSLINILVVIVGGFFIVSAGKMLQGDESQKSQLSVSGEGKIFVKPDIATFTVTIVTDGARVGKTQDENAARSHAVIIFLKEHSVQDKDVKTVNYSVQPQYQYDNGRPCLIGGSSLRPCGAPMPPQIVSYEVRHSLEVKVRNLNNVDDLLQGVVSAGGNEVSSVMFSVDDEKGVLAEVRKRAIEDAKEKARILAQDLGVRLKKIIGFSESGGVPIYARSLNANAMVSEAASAPQIQPGEQEIRSTITISYEFR